MMQRRNIWMWIAFAALVVAVVAFHLMYMRHCSDVARTTAHRALLYRSLGIHESGKAEFVALPPETPHRAGAAALGNALFNDKRLVKSSKRMCGVCHPPMSGGADDKVHAGFLTRSTQNAVFASCYLHDGRLKDLKDVVEYMVSAPELGAFSVTGAVERLRHDPKMTARFAANYETGLVASNVVDALVQRLRARVTPSGAFDRYLSGAKDALGEEQISGFTVFKAAACADCHNGPALGGRIVKKGRKVPALRGISNRARFLHDGSAEALEAAVASMPAAQKLPEADKKALLAFLGTL